MSVQFGIEPDPQPVTLAVPAAAIADIQANEAERAATQDELARQQDELDQEILEDPLAYERRILSGELGDGEPAEET